MNENGDGKMDGDIADVRLIERISDVSTEAWDACAGPDNPFVSHAFLSALEESRSVGAGTGWRPLHLVARAADGRVVAVAPMYLKGHSFGEYVFDQGWAEAWERAGGAYYPKLQVAVPFTPVPGPRLLIRPDAPPEAADALIAALEEVARRLGVSSLHVTFPNQADANRLIAAGWLHRIDIQFHWENRGYTSFEDFLGAFNSRKRKAVRRERAEVAASGVRLRTLVGDDIKPEHWDDFHRFYLDTADRKWGGGYLTRDFFHLLGETMSDRVALVLAEDDGRAVAGALNLIGTDTLFGRNWGSDGRHRFLHFEACYHRAIEFAIERGLKRVEAGAQGEHKIQRGYLPTLTHSAHWIADEGFRNALKAHTQRERRLVERTAETFLELSPYRNNAPG